MFIAACAIAYALERRSAGTTAASSAVRAGPDDRQAEPERRRGGVRLPRLDHEREAGAPGGAERESAGQRRPPANPVDERAADRVAGEAGERDHRERESGLAEAEPAHLMQVDEEERERQPAPDPRDRVAGDQRPGAAGSWTRARMRLTAPPLRVSYRPMTTV